MCVCVCVCVWRERERELFVGRLVVLFYSESTLFRSFNAELRHFVLV